jgi:PilZ domain
MDTRTLDNRTLIRTKMVLGLRLSQPESEDPNVLVHTLDISSSGAKLGALRVCIEPGSVLTVQRKHVRIQCRVMWSRSIAPGEIQIGIEFLRPDSQIWGLELEEHGAGVWMAQSER